MKIPILPVTLLFDVKKLGSMFMNRVLPKRPGLVNRVTLAQRCARNEFTKPVLST